MLRAGLNQMAEKGKFSHLNCIIGSCSKTLECPDSPVSGLRNKVVHPSSPKPPMFLQTEPTGSFSSSLLAESTLWDSLVSIFTIRCHNLLSVHDSGSASSGYSYSPEEPRLNSQYPYSSSKPSILPVLGDLITSPGFQGHKTCMWYTD